METREQRATLNRYLERKVSLASVEKSSRTMELSFSSEERVTRSFGYEILSHDDEAVDLSRLNSGRANVLVNHDARDWIGVVQGARIVNRKGVALVRFGESTRAKEIFDDVAAGILASVSVGYSISRVRSVGRADDGQDIFLAVRWQPHEISLVTVPADQTVGVGVRRPKLVLAQSGAQVLNMAPAEPQPDFQSFCRQQARRNGGVFGNSFYFGG